MILMYSKVWEPMFLLFLNTHTHTHKHIRKPFPRGRGKFYFPTVISKGIFSTSTSQLCFAKYLHLWVKRLWYPKLCYFTRLCATIRLYICSGKLNITQRRIAANYLQMEGQKDPACLRTVILSVLYLEKMKQYIHFR